jgi:hypothetical protein
MLQIKRSCSYQISGRVRFFCKEIRSELKGDTNASILDGVKIVQKSKQRIIKNKAENQNKYFSAEQF